MTESCDTPTAAIGDDKKERRTYLTLKRAFDFTAALLGLMLLSPLYALIAVLVKLGDGGPAFYRQRRVGWKGRPFEMLKFRSMVVDASKLGPSVTKQGDPRVTPVGRLLRRTKLDELPQLWNVLLGDMSLVGPRPEVPEYVARYTPEQRRVLAYRPGITDLATLQFREEEALLRNASNLEEFYLGYCVPRKCRLNLEYAEQANLWQDLTIIVRTLCPSRIAVALGHGLLLFACFWLAYQLRYDFRPPASERLLMWCTGCVLVLLQLLVLSWRGHFSGLLSFFSLRDVRELGLALGLVASVEWLVWMAGGGVATSARSVILVDGALAFLVLGGLRTLLRWQRESGAARRLENWQGPPVRVGVVGCGELSGWLVNELNVKQTTRHRVAAIFDDDPANWNKQLQGVPVVGMPECLLNESWSRQLDEVILGPTQVNPVRLQQVECILARAGIRHRTLPSLDQVLSDGPAHPCRTQYDHLPAALPSTHSTQRVGTSEDRPVAKEEPRLQTTTAAPAVKPADLNSQVVAKRSGRLLKFLAVDGIAIAVSFCLAYLIRFDFDLPPREQMSLSALMFAVVGLKLLTLYGFRQFDALSDYFSLRDLCRLVLANATASTVLALARLTSFELAPSWGVVLIDGLLCLTLFGAIRLGCRLRRERSAARSRSKPIPARRVGIVGAGEAGAILVRELHADPSSGLEPVVFLDDEARKWGTKVHGVPVVGPPETLSLRTSQQLEIDEVIISMPSASADRRRDIIRLLQQAKLPYRTVPSLTELALGRVAVSQLRPVEVEDLLGRPPIQIDPSEIRKLISGHCVMVTGAGGSIGSELCRQIAAGGAHRLLLVERSEGLLFQTEQELIKRGFRDIIVPLVVDILDRERMRQIFEKHRPHLVFHAAAHKHVPMMEEQPGEAIRNNTLGTAQVAELALDFDVAKFVLISTDKAINPTSVMGATKRLAEMFVQALAASKPNGTHFMAVRFGNVLGSSGSVIPTFKQQILSGGPVTVTHPEMTRYFMTIPEAVGLVLQTAVLGTGGEVFVLDMGKPVRIVDLARQLITLSGFEPDKDIKIEFVGLRPGEKLFEELAHGTEQLTPTAHPRISRLCGSPLPFASLEAIVGGFSSAVYKAKSDDLKSLLQVVIPEYTPYLPRAGRSAARAANQRPRRKSVTTAHAPLARPTGSRTSPSEPLELAQAALDQRLKFVSSQTPLVQQLRDIALRRARACRPRTSPMECQNI